MRLALAVVLGSLALLLASPALPCGAPFGPGMQTPTMNILVRYKAGVETYVFQPHFCGQASQFGLILPLPGPLSENPALADATLFKELADISAPIVTQRNECSGGRGLAGGGDGNGPDGGSYGATVIDRGQVGIFDWVLVKADTAASFTDWLDANGFPHQAIADPLFVHYVSKAWYFVAFKVNAGEAPPAGTDLCGDLGPIQLSFNASAPTVPTRIAAAAGDYYTNWAVYGLAAGQLAAASGAGYDTKVSFSGLLSTGTLASAPGTAKLATAGDRLVKIDIGFRTTVSDDLTLTEGVGVDFRDTVVQTVYFDCNSCAVGPVGASAGRNPALVLVPLLALLGVCTAAAWRRRRR
jgi:MYXO-CTERM domain-containing protein